MVFHDKDINGDSVIIDIWFEKETEFHHARLMCKLSGKIEYKILGFIPYTRYMATILEGFKWARDVVDWDCDDFKKWADEVLDGHNRGILNEHKLGSLKTRVKEGCH